MSWKTTDSAKRSGISDYNRGTIKQNTERFSADYAVISDLSLQYLYGFRNDSVNNNALEIRADSLAFNKPKSSGVRALRIAIDDSNNALIGRKVSGKEAGLPDYSDSLCFKKNGNIVLFGDTEYTVPNTGNSVQTGFTIHNSIGIDKQLYVSKDTHFYSNVNIDNSLNIGRNAHIKGDVIVDGSLTVFGLIKPNFTEVSGNFLVDKHLVVRGNTSVQGFSATDGSINDLSVNYFHLVNNGYVNPGATLRIDGSMVIAGELIFTGSATEIGTVSISGDASYNGFLYGSKNLYLGSKHQQDDLSGQVNKFIQATKSSMSTGDSYSMCFGKDISTGNQGQLSYYHNSSNSSVTLGVFGKNNIAINSNGTVSIGRDVSNVTTTSSLDVSGSVTVAAQSDYIYTTPSLHIDNTSKNDSTGASIKLTGKRNLRSENVSNSGYPYTTGADIIFENYNDANPTSNAAKKETTKIHGVIKTFQTDNSWNIGDMAFYGQDISSLYTGTDTSGITEFMRFDAADQFVRFSKDVGIGGVKGEVVNMTPVITTHSLPQYPDPSAVLDLRTYTYYGQTGRTEQPNWKGGNILLAPENRTGNNKDIPNGLIWKPLAGELTSSNTFEYNYTKESAGIKFMPAANFYRGGLAFFTNNTADVSTNAVERMRIDQSGNVGIGTSSPSSTLDVSGDINVSGNLNVQGQSTFNSNATMSYGASLLLKNQNSASANISVDSNNILEISNSDGVSIPSDVKGNLTLTTGYLSRDTPDSSGTDVPHGYLVGNYQYNSSGVGKKSYPIFALDNYTLKQENHINLGSFYGIGYTQNNNTFISAGDPSTNWGMYVSAQGKVGSFIDGGQGADSFFNPEGGKVGIGTKGPSQKLDVNGDINANGYRIGGNPMGIFGNTDNSELLLSIHGSGNPALRVHSNNNIAIGHDDGAPSLLTIGNSINSNSSHPSTAFNSGTKILLGNQGSNTSGALGSYYVIGFGAFDSTIASSSTGKYPPAYIGYQQKGYTDQTGFGDLVFGTSINGVASTQALERMRITKDGKIGIANSEPEAILHVKGEGVILDSDVSIGSSINDGKLTIFTVGSFLGTENYPNNAVNKALSIIDGNKNGTYVNIGTSSFGTSAAFGLNWYNSNTSTANSTDVDNALVLTCYRGYNKVGLNRVPIQNESAPILHIESNFNNSDPGINGEHLLEHPQVLITANPTVPGASNNNQYATLELKGSYVGSNGVGAGTITYGAGIRVWIGDYSHRHHGNLELYTTDTSTNKRTTRLTVGSNGNVSIGQPVDPESMFAVKGVADPGANGYEPTLSVNDGYVAINGVASQNTGFNLYLNGTSNLGGNVNIEGDVTMGTSSNPLTFTYNGTNLTTLISNSHSNQYLELTGGSMTGNIHFEVPNGQSAITGLNQLYVNQINTNSNDTIVFGEPLSILARCEASTFVSTSDESKKEDIETISDATEKLTSLRGVSYKLKEDEEKKTHYGVVAQELEKVFPDMVHGEEGDKSVAYMEIIGVLIETVKDLNKRIKKLEESSK